MKFLKDWQFWVAALVVVPAVLLAFKKFITPTVTGINATAGSVLPS